MHKTEPPQKRQKLENPELAPGRYVSKRERKKLVQTETCDGVSNTEILKLEVPNIILEAKQAQPCSFPHQPTETLQGHTAATTKLCWRPPDGDFLASSSLDKTIRLWDVFGTKKQDLDWSCDGNQIISGGYDKDAILTDIPSAKCVHKFTHKEWITSVKFHPSNPALFIAGGNKNGAVCWDTRSNEVIKTYYNEYGPVSSIEFIEGASQIVMTSESSRKFIDKSVQIYDFETGGILSNQVYNDVHSCFAARAHPTSSNFLVQTTGSEILTFSTKSPYKRNKQKKFAGHSVTGYSVGICVSPDGKIVGTGSSSGLMHFYSWGSGSLIKTMKAHASACVGIEFHPLLPSTVATGSWKGDIKIWE